MLIFLCTYLLMLIAGSIFILGFFTITRGKEVVLPDNSKKIEKEILGDWQLFWEQVKCYKKIYYSGKQLEFKLKILEQIRPTYEIKLAREGKSLLLSGKPSPAQIRDIEWALNTNVLFNDVAIFLYDEFPIYRFPEWVRKITNCYICLSSIGGSIFYWTINLFFQYLFTWSTNPLAAKLVFWIIFCISLSFLNKVIKENFDSEKK